MMKWLLVLGVFLMLMTGCQAQQTYSDNGNPGEIQVMVFDDDNGNRKMDQGELGVAAEVGISQDISCPASRKEAITRLTTSADGAARFQDVKPGKYCVALMDNFPMTTQITLEVSVSSETVTKVFFGVLKDN